MLSYYELCCLYNNCVKSWQLQYRRRSFIQHQVIQHHVCCNVQLCWLYKFLLTSEKCCVYNDFTVALYGG